MGMNTYNRQNPFMYLLETKEDLLIESSQNAIKQALYMYIFAIIDITILVGYNCLVDEFDYDIIAIILFLSVYTFINIKNTIVVFKETDTNQMIFGDEYKDINVNNEKLLSLINEYNFCIGQINVTTENIYIFSILFLLIMIMYVAKLFLFFI